MKTTATRGKVDYRLLGLLSDLVICSRCLQEGRVTPVLQSVRGVCRSDRICGTGVTRPSCRQRLQMTRSDSRPSSR